jgi:hypothetical protein
MTETIGDKAQQQAEYVISHDRYARCDPSKKRFVTHYS